MARYGRLLVALAFIGAMLGGPALAAPASDSGGAQRYIVTFPVSEREPSKLTQRLEAQLGFRADLVYQHAIRGFAGRLTATQVRLLEQRPDVAAIIPDAVTHVSAQTVPTGIERIGTLTNGTASIDSVDNPLPVDVAVIDTGIDTSHPDLNVAGGYNCTTNQTGNYRDGAGHGTHVAGTIAARDNDMGVVGVAPGARLWAVKVFDNSGSGYVSWFVCGVDWVSAHASTIEVANFSGSWPGSDTPNCGAGNRWTADSAHQAICALVNDDNVPLIVAAGNDGVDASRTLPAAYPETIAVGAIADSDGEPGGHGPVTDYGADDTQAAFSNYGPVVDIYGPGVNIYSTYNNGGYAKASGTSMATPHVTGAAALYRLNNPAGSVAQVRQWLVDHGEAGSWGSQPLVDVGEAPATPIHDAAIAALSASNPAVVGVATTVQVEVANLGNQTDIITVRLTDNGTQVGSPLDVTLQPGQRTNNVIFSWTPATTGAHTLEAAASIAAADNDSTNNAQQATVNVVTAVHDVAVTAVSGPATVTQGQSVPINVSVANHGTFTENVTVRLTSAPAGATDPASQTVTLGPGEATTVAFNWGTSPSTTPQDYTLTGSAGITTDDAPGNNSTTATITVQSAPITPQVFVSDITLTSSRARRSWTVTSRVTIAGDTGPVANAQVTIRLTGPSTNVTRTVTTNADGVASVSTSVSRRGTYTAAVTGVSASGYSYTPDRNAETSDSIQVQ